LVLEAKGRQQPPIEAPLSDVKAPGRREMRRKMMAVFSDPFDTLSNFQQALDAFRASSWLDAGPSGGGAYPPMNVFRKGDDFIIIAELTGVKKSEIEVQVKGRTLRLSGVKTVAFPEKAAVHRRERLAGRFDRAVTMPVEINPEGVKAEYRDGILALFLPCAESEKPKTIKVA
jgi:HSP20 family protein